MIRINLLPGGAQARRAPTRAAGAAAGLPKMPGDPRIAAVGGAAVLLLLLAGLTWWRTGTSRAALAAQVEQAVRDSSSLATEIDAMQKLSARQDSTQRKIDLIRSVDGRRYVWPHLMDEISRAMPQYTWLTKVTTVEEEEPPAAAAPATPADSAKADSAAALAPVVVPPGPTFTIEGNTGSTQALTRLMKNLEASPMVQDVALVTSEQAAEQGRTFLRFTLEAKWEEPDSAFVETVPVLNPPR